MANTKENQQESTPALKPHRPFVLTVVFWIFSLWILLGWLRFIRTVSERALILEWLPAGYYATLAGAGLVWGLLGLPVLWGIVRRTDWAPITIWIAGGIYPLTYWLERLCFWSPSASQENWLFMLLLTLFWLGLIFWAQRAVHNIQYFSGHKQ
jgi:hypothetical protein